MIPASIKRAYSDVPAGIKVFAKKAIILFVAWVLLYYGIMQPARVPDKWLTNVTAKVTTNTLNSIDQPGFVCQEGFVISENVKKFGSEITLNGKPAIFIADACNAFDLYILYIAFFICMPTTIKRVLIFSFAGITGIFILNILRCFALVWLSLNKPSYVDFAHHYLFTFIVYSCIFGGWVMYSKRFRLKTDAKV